MALEIVSLEHLPNSHKVYVALFRDVQNAAFLHQQLLARNPQFEYAFIDASVVSSARSTRLGYRAISINTEDDHQVVSRLQLLSAVFKATSTAVNGALRTPNVHSEIVCAMSSSNNIADAYRRYGISPSTKDLIVVKVTFPGEDGAEPLTHDQIWEHLKTNVEGEALPITDDQISTTTDVPMVRKYYKLNGLKWLDDIKDEKVKQKEMESLVIGAMALRGV
ncbi:EKC/KEOPS complex subunit CGI121 [Fusarium oxysporum f. sp. rapae]|uniref:EKC/KEOPS complex subunit CGI121 n=1 Tax=Fusarium oxysporum f. sp. rapae TaxID=485398 RepID=A0A8J5UDH9_FUSOX|nr:EKC/KEOPS complex subunit CGI121 [Fusarium oxysporum f. sp. rapae]